MESTWSPDTPAALRQRWLRACESEFICRELGLVRDDAPHRYHQFLTFETELRTSTMRRRWAQREELIVKSHEDAAAIQQWRAKNRLFETVQDDHACRSEFCKIDRISGSIYGCRNSGIIHQCGACTNTCTRVFVGSSSNYICVFSNADVGTAIDTSAYSTQQFGGEYVDLRNQRLMVKRDVWALDTSPAARKERDSFVRERHAAFMRVFRAVRDETTRMGLLGHTVTDLLDRRRRDRDDDDEDSVGMDSPKRMRHTPTLGVDIPSEDGDSSGTNSPSLGSTGLTPRISSLGVNNTSPVTSNLISQDAVEKRRSRDTRAVRRARSARSVLSESSVSSEPEMSTTLALHKPAAIFPQSAPAVDTARTRNVVPIRYKHPADKEPTEQKITALFKTLYDTHTRDAINYRENAVAERRTQHQLQGMRRHARSKLSGEKMLEIAEQIALKNLGHTKKIVACDNIDAMVPEWTAIVCAAIRMFSTLSRTYSIVPIKGCPQSVEGFALSFIYTMQRGKKDENIVVVPEDTILKKTLPSASQLDSFFIKGIASPQNEITLGEKIINHIYSEAKRCGAPDTELSYDAYLPAREKILLPPRAPSTPLIANTPSPPISSVIAQADVTSPRVLSIVESMRAARDKHEEDTRSQIHMPRPPIDLAEFARMRDVSEGEGNIVAEWKEACRKLSQGIRVDVTRDTQVDPGPP